MARRDYGTGTIVPRGPHRWQIKLSLAPDPFTGKRRRPTFTIDGSKRDAQIALRKALGERDQGIDVSPQKVTVGEWLTRWLARHHGEGNISKVTHTRYEVAVRAHLVPSLGDIKLRDLRRDHVADLKTRWLTGEGSTATRPQSAATVRKQLNVLRQALDGAVEAGLIALNPAGPVKSPPLPTHDEKRALTETEIRALLDVAAGGRLDVPIRFAIATGIRQGELLGMRWSDLDVERSVVHVRRSLSRAGTAEFNEPKAKSRRTLELSEATLQVLRRHRLAQNEHRLLLGESWQDGGLMFPSTVGSPWQARNFYRAFKISVVARTSIDDVDTVTWHTLRHTAASHWLMAGVTSFEVARRLGHASTNITERVYAHLLPGGQQKSAHALDHLVG